MRIIGIAALVGVAFTVWLGLWVTPPDQVQGNLVRLVYIHPGVAWVALYLAFGLAAVASLLYLWPRTRSLFWDRLAAAAVEVGVVFNVCTLISGSIWGKPTWGVYWAWDARLTSTALLLVLFLGYMALRRVPAEPEVRAKRSAFVGPVRRGRRPHRPLLGAVVEDAPPGGHRAQPRSLAHHPRVDGLDAAARLRGLDPGLRLDAAGPLPDRGARGLAGHRRAGRGPARAPGRRHGRGRRARGGLMGYVEAGYSIVLAILFLYAVPCRPSTPAHRAVARLD